MLKQTHSPTPSVICPPSCTCPMHHHKPMSLRKEAKILEHFANQRIGDGSRDTFIKLVEEEVNAGSPLQHLKYKQDFLNRMDPFKKKIHLSEKKSVDHSFIKYLLSDASPRNIKFFLFPEESGWGIIAEKKEPKKRVSKKTAQKKVKVKKPSAKTVKAPVQRKAASKKVKAKT